MKSGKKEYMTTIDDTYRIRTVLLPNDETFSYLYDIQRVEIVGRPFPTPLKDNHISDVHKKNVEILQKLIPIHEKNRM